MTIGEMREQIAIEKYVEGEPDGYGGFLPGTWVTHLAWARVQNLKGSETVIAARLTGVQPVVLSVYWTPDLAAMTTAWRVRNTDSGRVYDVKSVATDERRQFIEILAEYQT